MYNVDVLECVDCAPYEGVPQYCKHCGAKVTTDKNTCGKCGALLAYGGGAK